MSSSANAARSSDALRFLRFVAATPRCRWRTGRNRLRLDVFARRVGLFSSVNERYLGDPSFDPVFGRSLTGVRRSFIHPTHCEAAEHTGLRAPPFVVNMFRHDAGDRSRRRTGTVPPAVGDDQAISAQGAERAVEKIRSRSPRVVSKNIFDVRRRARQAGMLAASQ